MDDDDGTPGLEDAPTDWEAWMQEGKKREPSLLVDTVTTLPVLSQENVASFFKDAPSIAPEWTTSVQSTSDSQQKEPTQVYYSSPEMTNYLPSLFNHASQEGTPGEGWSTGMPATSFSDTTFNGSTPWAVPPLSNAHKRDDIIHEGTSLSYMPPTSTVPLLDNVSLSKQRTPATRGGRRPRKPKGSGSRIELYGYSAITATHGHTPATQMMTSRESTTSGSMYHGSHSGRSTINNQQFRKVLTGKEEPPPPPETLSSFKVCPFPADGNQFTVTKIDKKTPPFWETVNVDIAVFYTMEVIRNSESTVDELIFGECPAIQQYQRLAEEEELFMRIYFDVLIMLIERHEQETNTKVQLKVSHLTWNLNVCTDHILKIMSYLDPNYLQTLHLTEKKISTSVLKIMIGSPHWPRLTEIKINGATRLTLRSFYHCNTVNIQIKELHPVELANFIKNYHSKNLLYAPNTRQPYFFIIRCARLKNEAFIEQVFNNFTRQKIAEQYEIDATFMYKMHVFKYLSPHYETEEMCKVVYRHEGKINGYSCPKTGVTESFMHFDSDILGTFLDLDES